MPQLSKRGKESFIVEVCYVLAVSNEIAASGSEGLPPGMESLVEQISAVNDQYELDKIGDLIFEGNVEEASKEIEATGHKWAIVNALWKAQTGSPFHVHPAFGKVVAVQAEKEVVYFDIEMRAVTPNSDKAAEQFDLAGPAQVIRMIKDGDDWLYDGVDQQRSNERMEAFIAQSNPQQPQADLLSDPSFTGTTYEGKSISLADFKGKIVILDFWGTWCAPCVASMPEMKLIREAFAKHGVEIVGIAADPKEKVATFCKANKIPWPNIVDSDEALVDQFGVVAFPTLMMIDQNGKHIHADIEKADLVADLVRRLGLEPSLYAELQSLFEKKK